MVRFIGTVELPSSRLYSLSSETPSAAGTPASEHIVSALFGADKNGAPQIVNNIDAICAFDTSAYAKKRLVPAGLRFSSRSAGFSGLSDALLDFGAVMEKWSVPTYSGRPKYTQLLFASLRALSAEASFLVPLNCADSTKAALAANGLYLKILGAGAFSEDSVSGIASARLYPSALSCELYDIVPEVQNVSPNAGYVPYGKDIGVYWTFYSQPGFSATPKQAAFELSYRTQDESGASHEYVSITGDNKKNAVIQAGDAQLIWYRLRVCSDDGVWSDWTQEFRLSTIPLSRQCEGVSPAGRYVSEGEDVAFVWRHASSTGLPQRSARIYFSAAFGEYFLATEVEQRAQFATVRIPEGLSPGELRWYCVSVDESGEESLPSEALSNMLLSAPEAPVIAAVPDLARPTVSWRCAEQAAYRLCVYDDSGNEFYNSAGNATSGSSGNESYNSASAADGINRKDSGNVFYDTGMTPGADSQVFVERYMPPGRYTFEVTVWNAHGLTSSAARSASITVPNLAAASVALSQIDGGVMVSMRPPDWPYFEYDSLEVFRDGVRLARLSYADPPNFADFRAHGVCSYFCRLILANAAGYVFPEQFGDSAAKAFAPKFSGALVACASRPADFLRLSVRRGGVPARRGEFSPECVVRNVAGRERPVAEFALASSGRVCANIEHLLEFSLIDCEFSRLRGILESGEPIIYRDEYMKFYGALSRFSYERTPQGWDFSIAMVEVDYDEGI